MTIRNDDTATSPLSAPTLSPVPTPERRGPVVVGVHPTWRNRSAIDWAADEADATGLALELVAVVTEDSPIRTADADRRAEARQWAEETVTRLRLSLILRRPDLVVRNVVVTGDRSDELLAQARTAAMLVLGRRASGLAEAILGSTFHSVAAAADLPVTVVPDSWSRDDAPKGPVVVGIDPDQPHPEALDLAFREAARRKADLVVVSGVHLPATLAWEPVVIPQFYAELLPQADAAVRAEVGRRSAHFASVPVTIEVHEGPAVPLLLRYAEDARLVVLGRNEPGLPWGSVARGTLHRVHVPAMLVPHSTAGG